METLVDLNTDLTPYRGAQPPELQAYTGISAHSSSDNPEQFHITRIF